jgi:plastocyanin
VTPQSATARVITLVLMATVLAACSSASGSSGSADAGQPTTMKGAAAAAIVKVQTFQFTPHTLRVPTETTVEWSNDDEIAHTATSGKPRGQGVPGVSQDRVADPDGLFDEQLDGAGSTASFQFREAGTYPYFCRIHAGMSGVIVVS